MKTPRELRAEVEALEEKVPKRRVPIVRDKIEPKDEPKLSLVNCKSCGAVIDVTEDPDNWPLQCDGCLAAGVDLPPGYE